MPKDKVLMEFPVLWEAWECDSKAWIMERPDGTRYLRMLNHGRAHEAKPGDLQERITEYERVLALSNKALSMLAIKAEA